MRGHYGAEPNQDQNYLKLRERVGNLQAIVSKLSPKKMAEDGRSRRDSAQHSTAKRRSWSDVRTFQSTEFGLSFKNTEQRGAAVWLWHRIIIDSRKWLIPSCRPRCMAEKAHWIFFFWQTKLKISISPIHSDCNRRTIMQLAMIIHCIAMLCRNFDCWHQRLRSQSSLSKEGRKTFRVDNKKRADILKKRFSTLPPAGKPQ